MSNSKLYHWEGQQELPLDGSSMYSPTPTIWLCDWHKLCHCSMLTALSVFAPSLHLSVC